VFLNSVVTNAKKRVEHEQKSIQLIKVKEKVSGCFFFGFWGCGKWLTNMLLRDTVDSRYLRECE
jgi:hypothetical protein